ncbi:enoyl-CoA hydratase [bacterium]|nr:MAG: enoyl-CoA hydratase [bacterium]
MAYECVIVEKKDQVATVKINRPNKLNALNIQTVNELTEVFEELKTDEAIRVVVFTGAGEKAFAAGADITELTKLNTLEGLEFSLRGQKLCSLIENLGKPVVGAINGFALGGGCELAMSCTIRIAVKEARIGQPEVNLGTIPGYGGTQRLARLIPRGVAMELVITGRVLTADEALALGLVNKVVPKEEFREAVDEMAKLLLRKPPFAVRACIEAVLHGTEMSFEDGLRYEATLFAHTCGTEDMKEGTAAFLEKREARFTGK